MSRSFTNPPIRYLLAALRNSLPTLYAGVGTADPGRAR
jgi:hypothetical protein